MTAPFPAETIGELDEADEPTDSAGEEAQACAVDRVTCPDEFELPLELIGVPFS